jgi:hydrogenase expression/formation protein HypC
MSGYDDVMCLTIPSKLLEYIDEGRNFAWIDQAGVRRKVNTSMLRGEDSAEPGDYVLVHVGMAVNKVSAQDAEDTLALLRAMDGESGGEYDWAAALESA